MSTAIVFIATFGLSVLGSWYATDLALKWVERRKMRMAQARIKARLLEAVERLEKERT